mmetsp:Transcript_32878/g.78722  ORF Transcript_32878/g.78722 Transcript_32878/m.78722 type:complete len:653 (+) Transcript_32878:87-2045(+)
MDAPRALRSLRAEELRQLCKEQGLDSRGLKGELIQRLAQLRADQTSDGPSSSPQRPSPKAKVKGRAKAKAKAGGEGRSAEDPAARTTKSSPSTRTNRSAVPALLRRAQPGAGVSLYAASRQQLMRCVRCQALCNLLHGRYSDNPEDFWCPLCRFKVMDPFNMVVEDGGVLKLLMVVEPQFEFTLDLPDLRQWRREGKSVEVRMLRVNSTKVEQVWPRQIHVFANGIEVFSVHPPEEGHKRRDVPQHISSGLKGGRNDITVRMVDDDCVGFAFVALLTRYQSTEEMAEQVESVGVDVARKRVCELLAKQAASARAGGLGNSEDLVCLTSETLKLRCPITMERVQEPVRGDLCQHTQCFSLNAYMTSNRNMGAFNRRWLCPLCTQTLRPWDLRRDAYVAEVLSSTPRDAEEVLVNSDGSWRTAGGDGGVRDDSPPSDETLQGERPVITNVEETVDLDSPMPSPSHEPAGPRLDSSLSGQEPEECGLSGGALPVESPVKAPGSPSSGPRTPSGPRRTEEPGCGRPRLRLDKLSPAPPKVQDGGYDFAVAMSGITGVFSASNGASGLASTAPIASARQRRFAQFQLEDDDTSPAKKAQPKRRLPAAKGKSKRPRKGDSCSTEAATPARSTRKGPCVESMDLPKVGLADGLQPIDLD